jgi:hypothetical protein
MIGVIENANGVPVGGKGCKKTEQKPYEKSLGLPVPAVGVDEVACKG